MLSLTANRAPSRRSCSWCSRPRPAHGRGPRQGRCSPEFHLGDNPYAGGQHRGIDIGGAAGSPVVAPRGGTVTFAGPSRRAASASRSPPTDGYSVTLVHLGSIAVRRNAQVAEGAVVGTIGPTGVAAHPVPYVHLGVRISADPNGYLDPLGFLPPRTGATPPAPQPVPAPAVAPPPASPPAPKPPPAPPAAGAPAARSRAGSADHGDRRSSPGPSPPRRPPRRRLRNRQQGPAGTDPEPVAADPSGVTLAARPQPHERQVPPRFTSGDDRRAPGLADNPASGGDGRPGPAAGRRGRARRSILSARRCPSRLRRSARRRIRPMRSPRLPGCLCGHRSPGLGRRVTGGRPFGPKPSRPARAWRSVGARLGSAGGSHRRMFQFVGLNE